MKYVAILDTDEFKDFKFFEDADGKYLAVKDANSKSNEWLSLHFEVLDSCDDVNKLSPVIPQPKIGHWIRHDTGHSIYYDCSRCGCVAPCTETAYNWLWRLSNYCPDCGTKMEAKE